MKEPRLDIVPKKYTGETTVISLRIPKVMLRDLDQVAGTAGWTRNELLTRFIEFSLKHAEIVKADTEELRKR